MTTPMTYLLIVFIWGSSNASDPLEFANIESCHAAKALFERSGPKGPPGSPGTISARCIPAQELRK